MTTLSRERVEKHALTAVLVLLVLPLAITAVRLLFHGVPNPGGDNALIELRARDVGAHTPLLGSYGRYGFNQPGPLWFYLLAVPYRLLGSRYSGLQLAALGLGAGAIVAIVMICRRRGGVIPLLWAAVLLGVLLHGLGPSWVADPWEPHALTLACAALILLAYEAATGTRRWALPVTAAVATLLAQAQAGLLAFAMVMLGLAIVGVVVRARSLRPLVPAAAVLVVLWVPPLIALVRHDDGNLSAMWHSLRGATATFGLIDAWRAVALQLGPRAPWLGFREPLQPFDATLAVRGAVLVPVGLVALGAVLVVLVRRRDKLAVLAGLVAASIVAAIAALARLLGPLFFWIPEWTRAIGMACWLVVGWGAYRSLGDDIRARVRTFALPVLAVGLAAISIVNVVDALRYETPDDPVTEALQRLEAEALPVVRAANGAVLVTSSPFETELLGWDPGLATLVLDLERSDIDAVVDASLADRFGAHRAQPGRATMELRLTSGAEALPAGFRVVATTDPLTPSQRADRTRLIAQIPGIDPNATAAERLQFFAAHRDLIPLAHELDKIPDLPVLTLIAASLPQHP